MQRDCARHLSAEILQLQNISLEKPIMWHYLRDSTFSCFDTIPECDTHTDRCTDTTTAYTALSIASRCKKSTLLHGPPIIITTAGNKRRLIAKCTVIITYLNDNAQTPLNRLTIYMLYSHLCNNSKSTVVQTKISHVSKTTPLLGVICHAFGKT